jgi:hypothetical protein
MTTTLPIPIGAFIKAANNFDSDAFMATFAEDAFVHDKRRNFWGIAAIKKWADREIIGDKVTMEVVQVVEHHGDFLVCVKTDGNYDKTDLPDPLILDLHFTLRGDAIVKLICLLTETTEKA